MLQEPKMGSFKLSKGWSFSSFAKTFPNHCCSHHGISICPSFALLIYSSQRHLVRQSFMYLASWWFQPLWTFLISQNGNLPQPNRGGNKKIFETTTQLVLETAAVWKCEAKAFPKTNYGWTLLISWWYGFFSVGFRDTKISSRVTLR